MKVVDKLAGSFTFWISAKRDEDQDLSGQPEHQYKELLQKEFWSFFEYIHRPEQLPEGAQILLFQDKIQPVWEDPQNKKGGRFVLRVRRGWGNLLSEELILSFLQCQPNIFPNICGLVIHSFIMHTKKNFILISIWIKESSQEQYNAIQEWIIQSLVLKDKKELEFLPHPNFNQQ